MAIPCRQAGRQRWGYCWQAAAPAILCPHVCKGPPAYRCATAYAWGNVPHVQPAHTRSANAFFPPSTHHPPTDGGRGVYAEPQCMPEGLHPADAVAGLGHVEQGEAGVLQAGGRAGGWGGKRQLAAAVEAAARQWLGQLGSQPLQCMGAWMAAGAGTDRQTAGWRQAVWAACSTHQCSTHRQHPPRSTHASTHASTQQQQHPPCRCRRRRRGSRSDTRGS